MDRKSLRGCVLAAAACGWVVAAGGCALIPVAALGVAGNVADIGSTAFSAGTEIFSAGKLESVEFCTLDQGRLAVRSMLNDLRLRTTDSDSKAATARYAFADDAGADVDIDLKRRSPALCEFRIDVGLFGSEAYARLLLKSVRARIPLVANRPATRAVDPVDLLAPKRTTDLPDDSEH